jgi:hypothetical protein
VDHKRTANRPAEPANPGPQLPAVGVGGVAVYGFDLGSHFVLLTQNADLIRPALDPATQGVLRLEPDKEHQVPVVANSVGQVVKDAARFHHAGCRDDHRGSVIGVQGLRIGHLTHVAQQRKVE